MGQGLPRSCVTCIPPELTSWWHHFSRLRVNFNSRSIATMALAILLGRRAAALTALAGRPSLSSAQSSILRSRIAQPIPFRAPHRLASSDAREAYLAARQLEFKRRNKTLGLYTGAILLLALGLSYAAVPLYRIFCSATGIGGTPITTQGGSSHNSKFSAERLVARQDGGLAGEEARKIRITFNADKSDSLPWTFKPSQRDVVVLPGETALAFYTATNKSSEDIIGIATYNVMPEKVNTSPDKHLICEPIQITFFRLLPTSLKSSASVSKSRRSLLAKRSTYPSSSSLIEISSMIRHSKMWMTLSSVTLSCTFFSLPRKRSSTSMLNVVAVEQSETSMEILFPSNLKTSRPAIQHSMPGYSSHDLGARSISPRRF